MELIVSNQLDDGDYLPGLYIDSEGNPDEGNPAFEVCMNNFEAQVRSERRKWSRKYVESSLTPMYSGLIKRLSKMRSKDTLVGQKVWTSNNIETNFLTKRRISDHLNNQDVYKRLPKKEGAGN